ncbi:tetratricopeptide repeat protein [Gemmatimonas sp.]|uniref:tetratricopeptide repeat protein n=1 Tax=Gemmatimonas sp. TaxID=1962908 RepID=UPI0037BE3A7E
MPHRTVRSEHDDWMDDNTRGLSLAAAAEWDEATEAFAAAADVLARRAPDVNSHDALALILGNLAQACFRAGRTDDALQHAQRACALRAAIAGEDAMPVARARMDLAVMLGASGRLSEAKALIQRAIAAAERHVGDDDVRLVSMLDNAARLALADGDPASAEPLLLRLHALLDAHGMSTFRADRLIDRIEPLRMRADMLRDPAQRADVAAAESALAAALTDAERAAGAEQAVYAHASVTEQAEHAEWDDDQPLRDAVAVTDVLLRTTPPGVIAVPPPGNHDAEILAAFETVVDTPVEPMSVESMDFEPATFEPASYEPVNVEPVSDVVDEQPTPNEPSTIDLVDMFDFPLAPDEEPSAAFGIVVEHGYGDLSAPDPAPDARRGSTTPAFGSAAPAFRAEHTAPSTPAELDEAGVGAAMAPRVVPTRRTTKSNRLVKQKPGNRAGLIGVAMGAAVAAGGAVWYFLLR